MDKSLLNILRIQPGWRLVVRVLLHTVEGAAGTEPFKLVSVEGVCQLDLLSTTVLVGDSAGHGLKERGTFFGHLDDC